MLYINGLQKRDVRGPLISGTGIPLLFLILHSTCGCAYGDRNDYLWCEQFIIKKSSITTIQRRENSNY